MPAITILTPSRGRPDAFAVLDSVAGPMLKTAREWLVVCDGGADSYIFDAFRHRVIYRDAEHDTGHSLCHNLLAGLAAARGDIIAIVEDDDFLAPSYFPALLAAFD